ncbi:galactose oxidase [Niabella sp. 22666]|uniref:galactose oxidase n=1 Tax=Niabella sp. 22666 TaxID=3453954 RepID=UPI003F858513
MNRFLFYLIIAATMIIASCETSEKISPSFEWSQLSAVPDKVGFAGSFAGISNDHLIVAGGSQFPEGTRPWSGGVKTWNDKILALTSDGKGWKEIGRLPRAMGYGISLNWKDGFLLIGGANQTEHFGEVYFIRYQNDQLFVDTLMSLPHSLANSCGTIINNIVYVAGGLSSPVASSAEHVFWALDLNRPREQQQWKTLPSWPGEARMLGVAGQINGEFYLLSGTSLYIPEGDSLVHRRYLQDGFVFNPDKGWRKIKALPHPVVAAPSPAYTNANQQLFIFGGDDGSRAEQNAVLKDQHPGFRTEIMMYDARKDKWTIAGAVFTDQQPDPENSPGASTWAPVTTPLVVWDKQIIIPQGEARPGVRTNRVLAAHPQ